MKSKLGIYGDSYTRESPWPGNLSHEERSKYVWSNNKILTDYYDITNLGCPGSDFMYSYKEFKKSYHLYDKIIFVVTYHERHHFYIDDKVYFINDLINIDFNIKIKEIENDKNLSTYADILKGMKYHYVYTMQEELYAAGVTKLVEEMKKIRPDMIVEYAFSNQFTDPRQLVLVQVSDMENKTFDINLKKYKDCRPAHMTVENNVVFAEYIKKRLDGENVTISIDDFKTPTSLTYDQIHYFEEIK
jgi:hypothetical protein